MISYSEIPWQVWVVAIVLALLLLWWNDDNNTPQPC